MRMQKPVVTRTTNTAAISGSDFAGSVYTSPSSSYVPAASVLINPIYFQNGMLGSLARAYELFRFRKAIVQYVPSVPTSTQGQLVMTSTRSIKEPFINANSATFLSRALSQGNAVACPLWKEESITLDSDAVWHSVDALIDGDLDDSIAEEVQVYATSDATVVSGILILHYAIEFKNPLFTFHSTVIPCPYGNGTIVSMSDNTAVNALNDSVRLTPATSLGALGNGSVFRLVFIEQRSTKPAGPATWALTARFVTATATTVSATIATWSATPLASGMVFYGQNYDGDITLYSSYEAACIGSRNDLIAYATPTTGAGIWTFLVQGVKLGTEFRVTTN